MKKNKNIEKILHYILGINPDEFLLLPDENGFIRLKDLMKAIHETKDLRWISKSEILHCANSPGSLIEINENFVRSNKRDSITKKDKKTKVPGELYLAVRHKAWPHIHKKGINSKAKEIILSRKKEDALKLGRRITDSPLLLSISTKIASQKNVLFESFGEDIFLASYLPARAINGPDPEKITAALPSRKKPKEEKIKDTPGSFTPDIASIFKDHEDLPKSSWKRDKKRMRRSKKSIWPDQQS